MAKKYDYRGYTIIADYYAGYDAIYNIQQFITLATSPREWVDLHIDYFNNRVVNRVEL